MAGGEFLIVGNVGIVGSVGKRQLFNTFNDFNIFNDKKEGNAIQDFPSFVSRRRKGECSVACPVITHLALPAHPVG